MEEHYVSLINLYLLHNKKINDETDILKVSNLEDLTETNKVMEKFYMYINQYKENEKKDKKLIDVCDINTNLDTSYAIYCLMIDNKPCKISYTFLSLLIYLLDYCWTDINWKIVHAK